jgi:hypothetical protein
MYLKGHDETHGFPARWKLVQEIVGSNNSYGSQHGSN